MNTGAITFHSSPIMGHAINAARDGRMSVPVSPSLYIFSHFRHVSGVPAPEGTQGVTISRLKILDALIEQLVRAKQQAVVHFDGSMDDLDTRIDALIEQYQRQLQTAQAASAAAQYVFSAAPAAGLLFNISA